MKLLTNAVLINEGAHKCGRSNMSVDKSVDEGVLTNLRVDN